MANIRTIVLFAGLAGALGLFIASRTKRGEKAAADTVGGALDFIDVAGSRIGALVNSRGYRNNNPGNIRFIEANPWNGQVGNDGGYGIYSSKELGTRALGRQLLAYAKRGLVTVRDIIATWAPTNENDTNAYIADVAGKLGVAPDDTIDVRARLPALARAIARHENGFIDSSYDFETWVFL